jgi:hypothetical protein
MKTLSCERCGQRVFFENVACENCGAALGFVPAEMRMGSFDIDDDGSWKRATSGDTALQPCANYTQHQVCNWMVPTGSANPLCQSCATTFIVPALSKAENLAYWSLIEQAKRRLFYSLLSLKLPMPSKAQDPEHGVSFQFLEQLTPTEKVMTGHDSGVITLNIAEADDAQREQARAHLHEPYRTLLGHFRHEIGHYYWDRLVDGSPWLDEFRTLFGDERADYAEALARHYASPAIDWQDNFVSSYASSHPWEDWAECWAHYMHLQDGLETAAAWGLTLSHALPDAPPVEAQPLDLAAPSLEHALIEQWLPVSQFVNAMSRSLGSHDGYPFVVPAPVIEKLEFIHKVIGAAVRGDVPMRFSVAPQPAPQPAPQSADSADDETGIAAAESK